MNYCYITKSAIVLRNVINLSTATESNITLYEALYSVLGIPPLSSSAFSFTNLSRSAFLLFGVRAEQPNKEEIPPFQKKHIAHSLLHQNISLRDNYHRQCNHPSRLSHILFVGFLSIYPPPHSDNKVYVFVKCTISLIYSSFYYSE